MNALILILAYEKTEKALLELMDVLEAPVDKQGFVFDATVHRFECAFDRCLKLFEANLAAQGKAYSKVPAEMLRTAFHAKYFEDEGLWLAMLNDLHEHALETANREIALALYQRIKEYYPVMQKAFKGLEREYKPKA